MMISPWVLFVCLLACLCRMDLSKCWGGEAKVKVTEGGGIFFGGLGYRVQGLAWKRRETAHPVRGR